jgi:hypothetical protein
VVLLASCGSAPKRNSEAPASSAPAAANYAPKIGIAVRTASRTCAQIANANLAPDSPITLVIPTAPQSFTQAQVKAPSASACPITKDLNANVSSYELNIPADAAVPKQVPMFAVVGTSAPFTIQARSYGMGTTMRRATPRLVQPALREKWPFLTENSRICGKKC